MNLLLQKLKLQRLQKLQLKQAFRGFSGPCQPSPRCPERVHFCRADNFYLLSLKGARPRFLVIFVVCFQLERCNFLHPLRSKYFPKAHSYFVHLMHSPSF